MRLKSLVSNVTRCFLLLNSLLRGLGSGFYVVFLSLLLRFPLFSPPRIKTWNLPGHVTSGQVDAPQQSRIQQRVHGQPAPGARIIQMYDKKWARILTTRSLKLSNSGCCFCCSLCANRERVSTWKRSDAALVLLLGIQIRDSLAWAEKLN